MRASFVYFPYLECLALVLARDFRIISIWKMADNFEFVISDSEEEECVIVAVCAAAVAIDEEEEEHRPKRTMWVRDWLLRRSSHGAYSLLLQELAHEDPRETKRFLRMSFAHYEELLGKVSHRIKKQDTRMRKAIEPGERLAITLRFLGSGDAFVDLSYLFRVADNTIRKIVLETCTAIYEELKDEHLKVPNTPEEWSKVSCAFQDRWQLPNCIGALDGKHIQIVSPGRGSTYFNYLSYHSIILLALVDANYRIIWFNAGCNGRAGDAGVFRDSTLGQGLESMSLGVQEPRPLPGRTDPVPFFIVGDDAFGLKPYLMKPYPFRKTIASTGRAGDPVEMERRKQRIFDYRLSRARRISENVFGILAARFGVFQTAMRLSPEHATTVTLACLALHNYLTDKRDQQFAPPTLTDKEHPVTHERVDGDWRNNEQNCFAALAQQDGNRTAADARWVRDELKEYVNAEGRVPWQNQCAFGRDLD